MLARKNGFAYLAITAVKAEDEGGECPIHWLAVSGRQFAILVVNPGFDPKSARFLRVVRQVFRQVPQPLCGVRVRCA